jgi:hypothetical protein
MSDNKNTVPLVSYVSPELLSKVQAEARQSNRSLAGMIRDILETKYSAQPHKIETR